jgi:hypothetical protein
VAAGLKGSRYSKGAWGFMSQLSMCDAPPLSQIKTVVRAGSRMARSPAEVLAWARSRLDGADLGLASSLSSPRRFSHSPLWLAKRFCGQSLQKVRFHLAFLVVDKELD